MIELPSEWIIRK